MFAVAGALLGGAAAWAFRGRGVSLQRMEKAVTEKAVHEAVGSINSSLQGIRQELQQSVASAESRLGTKLQTQERAIVHGMSSHYKDMSTRLDTVNAASTELSGLSQKVDDLQAIFISPRRRGAFGELQLEAIIQDVMPPGSYQFQATLSNGKRPDCLLRLPQPIGDLVVDSKFPMDSFIELSRIPSNQSLDVKAVSSPDVVLARKKLSENLRKHVRDIANKYILVGETADSAIMFLPSEAVFAEIVENHSAIVTEAHQARVWIASPTTLMAVLTTMRGVVRGMAISERADAVVSEVGVIVKDVDRLIARSEKVERNVESARENLRLMRVSSDKIQRRKHLLDSLHETEEAQPVPSVSPVAEAVEVINGAKLGDKEEQVKM